MPDNRIAILASGNGTNAEAIIRYFKEKKSADVVLVLSNNPNAFVLTRAKNLNVPSVVFDRSQFRESEEVVEILKQHHVTHIVLAGFLWLIPENLIKAFPGRIINIHPALLPKHGGKGMYGLKVHEAVKLHGDTETGITIHLVNEHYDEGHIVFQEKCSVSPDDTPSTIADKVHELEYKTYPVVIERWVQSRK